MSSIHSLLLASVLRRCLYEPQLSRLSSSSVDMVDSDLDWMLRDVQTDDNDV